MTVSKFATLFSLVLLVTASEFAHAQSGVCRVTAFSIDHSIPHSASFSDPGPVGDFDLKFKGTVIVERFQHKETGMDVYVSVQKFESKLFSKKPMVLKVAIQLVRGPEDSYSFYGGAAESIYDKNWKGFSVSTHLRTGERKGYTFTVACEKRNK